MRNLAVPSPNRRPYTDPNPSITQCNGFLLSTEFRENRMSASNQAVTPIKTKLSWRRQIISAVSLY